MLFLKALKDSSTDSKLLKIDKYLFNDSDIDSDNDTDRKLRIKLKPIKSDFTDFTSLITDDKNGIKNGNSRIIKNYIFFRNKIEKSGFSTKDLYHGFENLSIVYIALYYNKENENENPQVIFESINSTGLSLTAANLIRNFILMGKVNYEDQKDLYENYWIKLENTLDGADISDFIRNYLIMKTQKFVKDKKNDIYNSFKKYVNENYVNNTRKVDSKKLLNELIKYGKYYMWFKRCSCDDKNNNKEINKRLVYFRTFNCAVIYPLLMFIFNKCFNDNEEEFGEEILLKTLDILVSYIVRRALCGIPSNSLNNIFPTIIKDIEDNLENQSFDEKLVNAFASKEGGTRFPKDQELRDCVPTMVFYKKGYDHFVLEKIERKMEEIKKVKETINFDNLSIEHIMPQNPKSDKWKADLGESYYEVHSKYLNTLGNLTLTGYNSELSDDSFLEKCKIYGDLTKSKTCLTGEIAKLDKFGEAEIVARCNKMIDVILQIWQCPPEIQNAKTDTSKDLNKNYYLTATESFKPRKPTILKISGNEYKVKDWDELMKELLNFLYKEDEQKFRDIVEFSDCKSYFKKDVPPEKIGNYIKLENIYVLKKLETDRIIKCCRRIVESFDEELLDEITFRIK